MSIGLFARDSSEVFAEQSWLEPVDAVLGGAVSATFAAAGPAGRFMKDMLHGTWLGHPLHPALTDLPLGAWTTAMVLDLFATVGGRDELTPGADAAVALGLAGAVGAALAGLADWSASDGAARRLGLVHGLLNVGATGAFAASLCCRLAGARKSGLGLGLLGFAIANYTAFLGGQLVYGERLGVDRSRDEVAPRDYVPVLDEAELTEGTLVRASMGATEVVLTRLRGRIHCLSNACSHLGCSLADGQLVQDTIVCGCHGSAFAVDDGRVVHGPATAPQPYFETRVDGGRIEARASAG